MRLQFGILAEQTIAAKQNDNFREMNMNSRFKFGVSYSEMTSMYYAAESIGIKWPAYTRLATPKNLKGLRAGMYHIKMAFRTNCNLSRRNKRG